MSNSKVPVKEPCGGRQTTTAFEPRAVAVSSAQNIVGAAVAACGPDAVVCDGSQDAESVGNSKVPVRDGGLVPPPGVPDEPCCIPPGTTVVEVITGGGSGGSGGTSDYQELLNKPRIEGVVLVGNRLLGEFGFGTATKYEVHQLFA